MQINDKQKQKISHLNQQLSSLNNALLSYLQGIKDTHELDDSYQFNMDNLEFEKKPEPTPKAEPKAKK